MSTALHTRASCDECGNAPATREGVGGVVLCEGCADAPPLDPLGAMLRGFGVVGRPLCSRCRLKPARLKLGGQPVCTWCSSFADGSASSGGIAASAEAQPPKPAVGAAVNSVGPERSGSPATAGEPWTGPPAVAQDSDDLDMIVSRLEVDWRAPPASEHPQSAT